MLKGYALYYAVVLILIISLILGSVILLLQFSTREINGLHIHQTLRLDARSGLNVLLTNNSPVIDSTNDLFGDGEHQVSLKRKWWGNYELLRSTATKSLYQADRIALSGRKQGAQNYALYLADRNEPLALTGKTLIIGNAYLPERGVKRAYIGGSSFQGKELVNGKIMTSETKLPSVDEKYLADAMQYLRGEFAESDSIVFVEQIPDSIHHSFNKKTLVLSSSFPVVLYQQISGNVILYCQDSLEIASSSVLDGILIIASSVRVRTGVTGNFQVFAKNTIVVEEDCNLQYPSTLNLISSRKDTASFIQIKERANIKGDIFIHSLNYKRTPDYLAIGKACTITGDVHVNGQIELHGSVLGSVACNEFILHTAGGVYSNHIMDGTIDASQVPEEFVKGRMITDEGYKHIVKWLD